MILWIESQNVAVIALIVFGLCYAIAALIFVAIVFVSRRPIASDLKATTPVMLTPLSVIAGLLIAFLASRVWSNVDRANSYVAQEASAISQVVLLTDALPDDPRKAVRDGLRTYLQAPLRTCLKGAASHERQRACYATRPGPGLDQQSEWTVHTAPGQFAWTRDVCPVARAPPRAARP